MSHFFVTHRLTSIRPGIGKDGWANRANYATSAAGQIRVEVQDAAGQALPGFALDDCEPIWGDHISRIVKSKTTPDLAALVGKPVRLRFEMSDADVFSIRFQ